MSDLPTRLRASAEMLQAGSEPEVALRVAADEIERLTADRETARRHTLATRAAIEALTAERDAALAALKSIAGRAHAGWASDVAKRALGGGQ